MNSLLKEYIDKEVQKSLNEGIIDSMVEKGKTLFGKLDDPRIDSGTKGAILAFLMGQVGLHKRDINYILNIDDENIRNLEIQYLMDKVFKGMHKHSDTDTGMSKYLYFGRKAPVR